jgi:hypothetical protein
MILNLLSKNLRLCVRCSEFWCSQQFREISVRMDVGGSILGALINTNVGWLAYLRHDDDTGFSSRNPMFDESDAALGGLAFDGLFSESTSLSSSIGSAMGRRANFRQVGRCPSATSCAPLNFLSSMRAIARHLYNGTEISALSVQLITSPFSEPGAQLLIRYIHRSAEGASGGLYPPARDVPSGLRPPNR